MADVLETLAKLPTVCYVPLLSDPRLVTGIKRGMMGYIPLRVEASEEAAKALCDRLNGSIKPSQLEAMQIGSMFGWEVPGADPDTWEA